MKKLIIFAIALLFLCATGIASAADISMSGDYYVQGTYQKNAEGAGEMTAGAEESGTMYYDHEFNLNATWSIDDNTSIITQFEMRDEVWGNNDTKEATIVGDSTSNMGNNIVVEKAYAWHKFANGHQLAVGLMPSGTWGTAFGDNGSEAYRVKYTIPTDAATIVGIIQKVSEKSTTDGIKATGATESDDADAYYLAFVTKAGNINVKPLFAYVNGGNSYDKLAGYLALDGTFGNISFESEFVISDVNYDAAATPDERLYGAYLKVANTSGPVTAGIVGAYGSYDDDSGKSFKFGDDFDGGGAKILGYDDTLGGAWLAGICANYAANDKLSIGGYAGVGKSIDESATKLDGAKLWELSGDASYKITDNLVYDVGAGVAQLKWGDSTEDPDKAYRLFHKLTVSF